ncbi:MAG: hypothetical protein LBI77_02200 [Puniceicoccales bacterium]|jgi:hypothetical protein|nr:hypothetical protein [Puniceicoccales bacterium]
MKKVFVLFPILGECALFSGCASDPISDDSQLPWNRPASWENRRDISAMSFHREYGPKNFYRNNRDATLKVVVDESEMQVEVFQMESDDSMKAKVIHHEPDFFSKDSEKFSFGATKRYPEKTDFYDFNEENSDFLRNTGQ